MYDMKIIRPAFTMAQVVVCELLCIICFNLTANMPDLNCNLVLADLDLFI